MSYMLDLLAFTIGGTVLVILGLQMWRVFNGRDPVDDEEAR